MGHGAFVFLALVSAFALLFASSAQAATVTLGQLFTPSTNCGAGAGTTWVPQEHPASVRPTACKADG